MDIIRHLKAVISLLIILALGLLVSSCGMRSDQTEKGEVPAIEETASKPSANDKVQEQVQEEEVLSYLHQSVPEVAKFKQDMTSSFIERIENIPDPGADSAWERDYYYVYVGSYMEGQDSRWERFYVKKDLSEVLVEDINGGTPLSLTEWREMNQGGY